MLLRVPEYSLSLKIYFVRFSLVIACVTLKIASTVNIEMLSTITVYAVAYDVIYRFSLDEMGHGSPFVIVDF